MAPEGMAEGSEAAASRASPERQLGTKGKETSDGNGRASAKRSRLSPEEASCSSPPLAESDSPHGGSTTAGGSSEGGTAMEESEKSEPSVCQAKVDQVISISGLSDADARSALLLFDGDFCDQLVDWLTCEDAKQKEEIRAAWIDVRAREAEKKRKEEADDFAVAQEVQARIHEQEKEGETIKQQKQARETARKSGMEGDLFERSTRSKKGLGVAPRSAPSGESSREAGRGKCSSRGGVARFVSSRRGSSRSAGLCAADLLGAGKAEVSNKHDLLERAVIVGGSWGRVCQAWKIAGDSAVLMIRFENSTSGVFLESDFVTDPAKHYESPDDTVLLLPRFLHLRGSIGQRIVPPETNLFHYEEKVVCEVPANYFGPKFEYIQFQILDPDEGDFTIQERIEFDEHLHLARSFVSQDTDNYGNPRVAEDEKKQLEHGPRFKLRIFDTNKCRCSGQGGACDCKKGRGWGVVAEEAIQPGQVVMEYVGVVKLKHGKRHAIKFRDGRGAAGTGKRAQVEGRARAGHEGAATGGARVAAAGGES